jgi:outer membrane protein assembly factor BamB
MRNEKCARKEAMKRLFTTKRLLPLGLALLLLVVLLGAAFLLIPRPTTRWSYQPGLYSLSQFPPIANPSLSLIRAASSLQVVNGIAYLIYTNPTTLYALDTRTGQVVWNAPTDSQMPTIANGLVYVYSGTTYYRDGALICGASCPTSAADITDETGNGALSALDARSGRQRWSHPVVPFKDFLTMAPETAIEGGGSLCMDDNVRQGHAPRLECAFGERAMVIPNRRQFFDAPCGGARYCVYLPL